MLAAELTPLVLMEQPGSAAPGSPSALGNHLCFVSSLLIICFSWHLAPFAVHGGQVLRFCPLIGLGEDSFTQNYRRFFCVCVPVSEPTMDTLTEYKTHKKLSQQGRTTLG